MELEHEEIELGHEEIPYAAELVQQNQFFQIMVCRFFSGQNVQKCQ